MQDETRAREVLAEMTGLALHDLRAERDDERVLQGSAIKAMLAFAAPPAGEREEPSLYQFGNRLFVDLRAFLSLANVDPSGCKVTITVPAAGDRDSIVNRLRKDAPPTGNFGRVSSAQAGNNAGQWQGVAYEIQTPPHHADREAIARDTSGFDLVAAIIRHMGDDLSFVAGQMPAVDLQRFYDLRDQAREWLVAEGARLDAAGLSPTPSAGRDGSGA